MAILSICIPTYNGRNQLRSTLESLVSQFGDENVRREVEIVISDDASRDKTADIAREFAAKYPNIRAEINETNLGFDRNVDKVIGMARGSFCWTLSQDEGVLAGGMQLLLSVLTANPEAAYVCISNQPKTEHDKDAQYFSNGNEWLQKGLNGGLISQNIFNREYLPVDRSKYFGNLWFHFSMALEMIAVHPAILVRNIFIEPQDNIVRWARGGLAIHTFTNLKKIIENLPRLGYRQEIIDALVAGFAKDLPRTLASARLHGLPVSWKIFKMLVSEYKKFPINLTESLILYFTPVWALRGLKKIGV